MSNKNLSKKFLKNLTSILLILSLAVSNLNIAPLFFYKTQEKEEFTAMYSRERDRVRCARSALA
jgi:hypothetical protein